MKLYGQAGGAPGGPGGAGGFPGGAGGFPGAGGAAGGDADGPSVEEVDVRSFSPRFRSLRTDG